MAKKNTSKSGRGDVLRSLMAAPLRNYSQKTLSERPFVATSVFRLCRQASGILPLSLFNQQLLWPMSFLMSYYRLMLSFYNAGLTFTVEGKSDADIKDIMLENVGWKSQFTDPKTRIVIDVEINVTREEAMRNYVRDLINEYLVLDSAICFWEDNGVPLFLMHEKCRYQDTFGIPILWYTHGLSTLEISNIADKKTQERFTQFKELLLDASQGEHFKILKRVKSGDGFGIPRLMSLFKTMGELDSKEEFSHAQAYLLRKSPRQHKLGHANEWGDKAGRPDYFWNPIRDKEVRAQMANNDGPFEFTTNFDHELLYPIPDLARFDETLWKGSNLKLAQWGGPIAQMLIKGEVDEKLLGAARTMILPDRQEISSFLQPILGPMFGFDAKDIVTVAWSEDVFIDPIRASDLLKFAVQNGLSSKETTRKRLGLPMGEDARKLTESQDPDAIAISSPMYDATHDTNPALRSEADINGKPALAAKAAVKPPGAPGKPRGGKKGAVT